MPAPLASYWSGGPLDYIARAALISWVRQGHAVTLWAPGPVPDPPEGVTLRDARALRDPDGLTAANRPLLPDILRWDILAACPGAIFLRPEFLLLAPLDLPQDGYLFGLERAGLLAPDPVALPADSAELAALRALAADPTPIPPWLDTDARAALETADPPVPAGHQPWGLLGGRALTHVLGESGRLAAARPVEIFHPLPYAQRAALLTRKLKIPDVILPGSLALPLHRRAMLREIARDLAGLPRYWCPLGEAIRRAGVEPRLHLPPGMRLLPKDTRWEVKEVFAPPPAEPAPPVRDAAPEPGPGQEPDTSGPPAAAPASAALREPRPDAPRIGIVTCMKNEGPFILEWIAHHRAIGVTDFFVYTNDCTDGTDALLDLLVEKGIVTARYDNPFRPDTKGMSNPQFTALEDFENRGAMEGLDWLAVTDVDEFINVKVGDGTLQAAFDHLGDATAISMQWHLFGNDDRHVFDGRMVTETMWRAAPAKMYKPLAVRGFKTLFRLDGTWQRLAVHRPKDPAPEKRDAVRWYAGSGKPMPESYLERGWRLERAECGFDVVALDHYAVRDAESYLVKRDRGRINHQAHDQGLSYWFRMNHNVIEDRSMERHLPATRAEMARLLEDAQIAGQNAACHAAHRAKIADLHAREDMKVLYAAITGPVLETLSRVTPLFGHRVFNNGPHRLPDPVLDWARAGDGTPMPPEWHDPDIIPGADAHPDRLLPAECDLHFEYDFVEEPEFDRPRMEGLLEGVELSADGQGVVRLRHLLEAIEETAPRTLAGDLALTGIEAEAAYIHLQNRHEKTRDGLPRLDAPLPRARITIVSAMRNEAPFILEWVAWHLAIGVTDFLVYTNDCTDNTNAILDRLAEMGLGARLDNPFNRAAGQKPQRGALNHAATHPLVTQADWVGVIDVDEFVQIHVGDGTLDDLMRVLREPNVVSMTWRFFGNGAIAAYDPAPVTTQFTSCAPRFLPKPRRGWGFKSMVHRSAPFAKLGVHRPLDLDETRLDAVRWVNGSGIAMPEQLVTGNGWRSTKRTVGYDMVTLNHYILRSAESFLVKRERGRINHVDQDQGLQYWTDRNYNSETDTRAADFFAARVAPKLAELMADPVLGRLHEEAVTWHRARIAHLRADPDYAALYDAITDPGLEDALLSAAIETDEDGEP